jgi:YggT family protein
MAVTKDQSRALSTKISSRRAVLSHLSLSLLSHGIAIMKLELALVLTAGACGAAALRVTPPTNPVVPMSGRSTRPVYPASVPMDEARGQSASALALGVGLAVMGVAEPALAAEDVSWIAPTKLVLQPLLTLGTVAFVLRTVLSWFPKYDLKELPWSVVAAPTEPFLKPTRMVVPPVAGVDISPIVWVGILSFFSEILCGPQGLLTIMQKKAGM